MKTPTTIGFDMGATTTKTGAVSDGRIILRGKVIDTRQDGNTSALIDSFIKEIHRLKDIYPEVEAVGFGVLGIINPAEGVIDSSAGSHSDQVPPFIDYLTEAEELSRSQKYRSENFEELVEAIRELQQAVLSERLG